SFVSYLPFSFLSPSSPSHPVLSPLSLHDALPIFFSLFIPATSNVDAAIEDGSRGAITGNVQWRHSGPSVLLTVIAFTTAKYCIVDRKSTRLNSSHVSISYAVFCLKKKKKNICIAA